MSKSNHTCAGKGMLRASSAQGGVCFSECMPNLIYNILRHSKIFIWNRILSISSSLNMEIKNINFTMLLSSLNEILLQNENDLNNGCRFTL